MKIVSRFLTLTLLWCVAFCSLQATLPQLTEVLDGIYLHIAPMNRQEVNTPIHISYMPSVSGDVKAPCDGTVTVTCMRGVPATTTLKGIETRGQGNDAGLMAAKTGDQKDTPTKVYSASLLTWKFGTAGAVTVNLPAEPGVYSYVATLTILDPDDPAHVWTMASLPITLGVFRVLERTTVPIDAEGGTVASPTFPDAPRITFPKKALTGTAQVTLEVLSLPPHPSLPGTDRTDLGHAVQVHVQGAALAKDAVVETAISAPPPPKYPHYVFPNIRWALQPCTGRLYYQHGGYRTRAIAEAYHDPKDPPTLNTASTDWEFNVAFKLVDQRNDYEHMTGKKWTEKK
ncbi:MAG TPA: hypothetical protein VHV83_18945 [Armatimonadota bacterium]|nr:hypothetical protein [Armatimonadota bacterium]